MELPAILKEENVEAAAELLRRYYLEPSASRGGCLVPAATLMNGRTAETGRA